MLLREDEKRIEHLHVYYKEAIKSAQEEGAKLVKQFVKILSSRVFFAKL
jgi:hypothetical protein